MNIFDCALKMEADAKEHYDKLAAAAPTSELQNLFQLLASAEEEHLAALAAMKENIAGGKTEFKALDKAACVFRPLLDRRELMAELQQDPDGYRHVVHEEEESIKFYEQLAGEAENDGTRRLLLDLAAQERRHLNIVENIYSFIEAPRTYLAWGEFSNLNEL
ncbi:ferritin [Geotalea uraniireducens]|uniref:Ferritin n=1 Tax=Geotalea uraniireducens TaxID=351604 RepID=A0ABM8EJI9_9BACT|nr:ferritin family protein [Geotalea uraniireducens]BDV42605.1 ferritin [Geotalea uraniireducens]